MARTLKLGLLALATLALALPTTALATGCIPSSSTPDETVTVNGRSIYYLHDDCGGTCLFAEWVYLESNGWAGLQRHDSMHDDTCGGMIAGDLDVV